MRRISIAGGYRQVDAFRFRYRVLEIPIKHGHDSRYDRQERRWQNEERKQNTRKHTKRDAA